MAKAPKTYVDINSLSDTDKKRVKKAISEMNDSMTRGAGEKDLQKTILEDIEDSLHVEKKLLSRLAKTYFKANYADAVEADERFDTFYNGILKEAV